MCTLPLLSYTPEPQPRARQRHATRGPGASHAAVQTLLEAALRAHLTPRVRARA